MKLGTGLVVSLVCGLIGSTALAREPVQGTLTFEDRVKAQRAIERVYYSHQLGATKPFDEAVRTSVTEAKVRKYLDQTAALNSYWKTAVTDQTLQRELERMSQGTKMPERLLELYAALGNDPFLIKECLARPALVDRLTHNFHAFDPTLHVRAKAQADAIRSQLVSGVLSPSADHPDRAVSDLVVSETPVGAARAEQASQRRLAPEDFQRLRAALPERTGQVSDVKETRDAFVFDVILAETAKSVRVAHYAVRKSTWDAWWDAARRTVRGDAVMPVASGRVDLPVPRRAGSTGQSLECAADDTWANAMLTELPEPREDNTTIWTGELMIVWGGSGLGGDLNTGSRYDPATDTWTATSTVGAPAGRDLHTAVWSGNVMIVWGGGNDLNSGGRYDPLTDSWEPTSTQNAPNGRVDHAAVWTGSAMVVWGGGRRYVSGEFNTGALYDPQTDTWTPTSTDEAPFPSGRQKAVWTGSEMIVWSVGGAVWSGRYNPASDTWTTISTVGAPQGWDWDTVVWTGTEMIVWGGWNYSTGGTDEGGRYDPATDTWTATSTVGAPHARYLHSAIWTGSVMVVWGGRYGDSTFVRDGARYEPNTDTWIPLSSVGAPSARARHSAIWTGSTMVVWGGDYYGDLTTGGRYAPDSDSWTPTATSGAPDARRDHTAVWSGNLVVIWGGYNANFGELETGGRYDPVLDAWTPTARTGVPTGRYAHSAVWTGTEMIVWGGFAPGPDYPMAGGRYDPVSDQWSTTSVVGAPDGRYGHTAVWTGRRMIVWGGYQYPFGFYNSGGRYDPSSDTWTPVSFDGAPSPRDYHSAVWTGRWMVVWGGEFAGSTGGRYDPDADTWMPTSVVGSPSARDSHTAVWTGGRMIVWGGEGASFLDTGGRYDPVADTWASTSTLLAPSQRVLHTAIWTGNHMVIWGGIGRSVGSYPDGGRYNPVTDSWSPTSTVGAPAGRRGPTAVWTGRAMVVWGGSNVAYLDTGGCYIADASPDLDGDGYAQCAGDCDDGSAATHPGAADNCDGVDNDCDGAVDNGNALCNDQNPCTDDLCTGTTGCAHTNNTRSCDDRIACTTGDACSGGACVGTVTDGIACNDGDACTTGDTCAGGACTGTTRDCDDHNVCTTDLCVWYFGCYTSANTNPCSDGNACTVGDVCSAGSCVSGAAVVCNDGNACTDDSCNTATGACVFTNDDANTCNDQNLCTQTDTCHAGTCGGSNPVQCSSTCPPGSISVGEYCQKTYDIDESLLFGWEWWCDGSGTDRYTTSYSFPYGFRWIDHGVSPATVTKVDVQLVAGRNCYGGQRFLELNDVVAGEFYPGYSCQCPPSRRTISITDVATESYVLGGLNTVAISNESTYLGEGLSRSPALGGYFARVTVTYAPHDGSCWVGTCAPATGQCEFATVPDGTNCADDACSTDGRCAGGLCQGSSAIDCDDRNACTYDACDPQAGCYHIDQSNTCDDGNPCTDDVCISSGGCAHSNNTRPCSDDNLCTIADACGGGECRGSAIVCSDDNSCTTDLCDPATGCVFTSQTGACDDGNPCTSGDACGPTAGSSFAGENFDTVIAPALPEGWISRFVGNGSLWMTRSVDSDTPPNSAFGIDSEQRADEVLETSPITISSTNAILTFRNRWRFEDDQVCYDAAVLEIQIGSGPFEDIVTAGGWFVTGGYNDWVAPSTNSLAFRAAWCRTSEHYPAFVTTSVMLPPSAAGRTIRLRWWIGSDSAAALVGQEIDTIVISDGPYSCHGGPATDCDDQNSCTDDSCDPSVGCVHGSNTNSCDDGNVCTSEDACQGGSCVGAAIVCSDNNPCTTDTCNPTTGCVFTNNTNACEDGNPCTRADVCSAGTCVGGNPLVCGAPDPCHDAGACNTATGACSYPIQPNGTTCDDGSLCTTGDTCQSGTCTPAFSGLNHPAPKSAGYYKKLCEKRAHNQLPYQGDQLTLADASCVGELTSTFAGMATIDEICDVVNSDRRPPHGGRHHGGPGDGPGGKECDKGEDELIATALNICRARVCEEQGLDSRCHGNTHTTVSQSFADADAILDDAARDKDTCKDARCELREINNGHALEMNSLTLSREGNKVKLTWSSPVLDDGSGTPSSYELWRRPMGSNEPFVKIGTTSGLTFLDATAGSGLWEYDLTAVIPGN